ncbi:hypothetical protein AB3Z07_12030 [Metabacillus halosaccharovorans]|uniref:hypothetical protein n=1 Tax=Metabacillus halosaccharovorans TaxID=930124 RepID=UPI0034CE3CA0
MKIRCLTGLDSAKYKSLRLEALQNNPEAFSSSYEEEEKMPIQQTELAKYRIHSYNRCVCRRRSYWDCHFSR